MFGASVSELYLLIKSLINVKIHSVHMQELWVRRLAMTSMLHTGWSSTCCTSWRCGMDRWQHS